MIDKSTYREAMSGLGAAVNVVTSKGRAGLAGCTVSAVCSVTDEPPTLLVCINRASKNNAVIRGRIGRSRIQSISSLDPHITACDRGNSAALGGILARSWEHSRRSRFWTSMEKPSGARWRRGRAERATTIL